MKKFVLNDDLIREVDYLCRRKFSQNERNEEWEKLSRMANNDKHWLAKIDIARKYIEEIDFPFKGKVPAWAKEGKDYIIIPDGTEYHSKDINSDPIERDDFGRLLHYDDWRCKGRSSVYDYAKEGLMSGEPRAEWNGGAGLIFDGKDVLLTCNTQLFEVTKKRVGAQKDGMWNHFFNAKQDACFDSYDLDRQFRNVICHTDREPMEEARKRTLYWQFYDKIDIDPAVSGGPTDAYIGSWEQRYKELYHKLNEYDKEQEMIKNKINNRMSQRWR